MTTIKDVKVAGSKPRATERIRLVFKVNPQYERVRAGTEIVRAAFCPVIHDENNPNKRRRSIAFCGVNDYGWLFRCTEPGDNHYFMAEPPA